MLILGIETAVEHVGVALGDHRGTLATATVNSDRRHAESLAPMVEFVCAQAGMSLRQLDAVAVDVGPGLFTGLRVGIAAAQSLGARCSGGSHVQSRCACSTGDTNGR
ncbi:MAG: hypothetical protein RLZ84_1585 [Actinomycetota bacterium]